MMWMALAALLATSTGEAGSSKADISASVFLTSPYGALLGCGYYRDGCGPPVGLGIRGTLALVWNLHLEVGADMDTLVTRNFNVAITPMLGLWRPFALTHSLDIYPEVSAGVTLFPKGFETASAYYDVGIGLLWKASSTLRVRGEITFRGARVGVLFD